MISKEGKGVKTLEEVKETGSARKIIKIAFFYFIFLLSFSFLLPSSFLFLACHNVREKLIAELPLSFSVGNFSPLDVLAGNRKKKIIVSSRPLAN